MSKLEELINTLCPNGVEYKELWELTAWDKKFNAVDKEKQKRILRYHYFLASDLKPLIVEGGNVKILTTNTSNLYTTEEFACEYLSEGEIVCIPWGGNPNVQYYKGKFITADNRISTSLNTKILDNKFLYYYLQNQLDLIATFYRGSGIKHPSMQKVLDLKIPVPPIAVQREIVRILDNFTELTEELTEELTARKKQYEYYRDELLNLESRIKNVEWKKLGDVCSFQNGFAFKSNLFRGEGSPIIRITNIQSNGIIVSNLQGYVGLIDELTQKYPLTEPQIVGEKAQKDFIALFGAILRMRNILSSFDEFSGNEILSERDMQDYQGRYNDLYDEWRARREEHTKEDITDDIVFEIELIKQVEINIDYILLLVKKYHDGHCEDKEILISINKAIDSSLELRSKKALIENFIAGINDVDDVLLEWKEFVAKKKEEELATIISEERLKDAETRKFVDYSFRDGIMKTTGTDLDKIMPPMSRFGGEREKKKATITERLLQFFERFFGIG